MDCDKGGRGLIGQSLSKTPIVSETYRILESTKFFQSV